MNMICVQLVWGGSREALRQQVGSNQLYSPAQSSLVHLARCWSSDRRQGILLTFIVNLCFYLHQDGDHVISAVYLSVCLCRELLQK